MGSTDPTNSDGDERDERAGLSRRSILKSATVSAVGIGAFTRIAGATDVTATFDIECLGDMVTVTLTSIDGKQPATLNDLRVYLGKESVVTPGGANDDEVDAIAEIGSCFFDEYSYKECPSPIAFPTGSPEELDDGSLVYTFNRADAGLETVTDVTSVLVAGVYQDSDGNLKKPSNRYQSFDSLEEGRIYFDPATCCYECDTGDDLLIKYEWDGSDSEFKIAEGGDDRITLESVTLDEDGEPIEACFSTTYCELDAVVKAGPEYDVTEVSDNGDGDDDDTLGDVSFCVSDIDGRAISNIRLYCEAPDDLGVGGGKGNN